jgi:hypothetical protein
MHLFQVYSHPQLRKTQHRRSYTERSRTLAGRTWREPSERVEKGKKLKCGAHHHLLFSVKNVISVSRISQLTAKYPPQLV